MSKSGTTISYGYNADGMRISKTVNGTKTEYSYLGSQLVEMKQGSNTLHFTYDSLGPATVVYNGTTYYYLKNAQGDVYGIANGSGSRVVNYSYDAWGKLLSTTGSAANGLGALNPLRYRGYVYDNETGFYYLQTRYYNPDICRFINADGYANTGQGVLGSNAFVYCGNEPIKRFDSNGESWQDVFKFGLAVTAVGIFAMAVISTGGGALALAGIGASAGAASVVAYSTSILGLATLTSSVLFASLKHNQSNTSTEKDYVKAKNNQTANKWAKEVGYKDAETLKNDYAPKNGSKFNMYTNKKTGEIILLAIRKALEISTGLHRW